MRRLLFELAVGPMKDHEWRDGIIMISLMVAAILVATLVMVLRYRRVRKHRERAADRQLELAAWAESNQWRCGDGCDPVLVDEATTVLDTAGDVTVLRSRDIPTGSSNQMEMTRGELEFGAILRRETATGHILLFDCWRSGGLTKASVVISLTTDLNLDPATVDVDEAGRIEVVEPTAVEIDLPGLFRNRGGPARLRFLGRRITLQIPGQLVTDNVEELVGLIREIDRQLPRVPGTSR